jgi:hypothetical protein
MALNLLLLRLLFQLFCRVLNSIVSCFRKNREPTTKENAKDTTIEELTLLFGLTPNEAKAWLDTEPKYPTDETLQRKRTDKDFIEPKSSIILFSGTVYSSFPFSALKVVL